MRQRDGRKPNAWPPSMGDPTLTSPWLNICTSGTRKEINANRHRGQDGAKQLHATGASENDYASPLTGEQRPSKLNSTTLAEALTNVAIDTFPDPT